MTSPSMEVQYILPDGTLTYDGIDLLQSLLSAAEATLSMDSLSDVVITTPSARQVLRYDGTNWVNSASGERVLLATRTAAASASLDFTEFNSAVYRWYEFEVEDLLPATDDVALLFRTSTNAGVSYDSGAADYQWSLNGMNGTAAASSGSAGAGSIVLTSNTAGARGGNAAGEYGVTGLVRLFNASTTTATDVQSTLNYMNTATAYSSYVGAGARVAAADVDAVRFLFNGSNTTSGTIRMFGIV